MKITKIEVNKNNNFNNQEVVNIVSNHLNNNKKGIFGFLKNKIKTQIINIAEIECAGNRYFIIPDLIYKPDGGKVPNEPKVVIYNDYGLSIYSNDKIEDKQLSEILQDIKKEIAKIKTTKRKFLKNR